MKKQSVSQRLMAELILIGGDVMSRADAMKLLQGEGVSRQAIDWCVFKARALSEGELYDYVRADVVLALRLRCFALMNQ